MAEYTCGKNEVIRFRDPTSDFSDDLGYIIRMQPCPLPGWWARWWHSVRPGEIWTCNRCKYRWAWEGTKWVKADDT